MMRRGWQAASACLGAALFSACAGSCAGSADADEKPLSSDVCALGARLEEAWPVRAAEADVLAPLAGMEGWALIMMKRDAEGAARSFGSGGGANAARAHADIAAVYRMGALASGNAVVETYVSTPAQSDPVGVAHLLTIAYSLNKEADKAKAASAKLDGIEDPSKAFHAPWATWVAAGTPFPPDLSTTPVNLPAVAVGATPKLPPAPHYSLPEQQGSKYSVDVADPGALVALALWHDKAARMAAGDQEAATAVYLARYAWPSEAPVTAEAELPFELLFGSENLTSGDANFFAAVRAQGPAAVDAWKDRSLEAALTDCARVDGTINPEKAFDIVDDFREAMITLQREAAKAKMPPGAELPEKQFRTFSEVAARGVIRTMAEVAELEADPTAHERSGLLRLNARDIGVGNVDAPDSPEALLSLAAWDARNRYPGRGTDIVHNLTGRYPSLETARFGLDVLAVRVQHGN